MHPSGADYLVSIQSDTVVAPDLICAKTHSPQPIAALGLYVLPALVLAMRLFEPCFNLIKHTPAWRPGQRAQWPALCGALRTHALTLPLTDPQRRALEDLAARLPSLGKLARYAVRSSAPGARRALRAVLAPTSMHRMHLGECQRDPGAFTTDPGWTPLFIHAAAVIPEVDPVGQHGAVGAREYGKPCVAGIADVDGSSGVVRFVSGEADTT